MRYTYFVTAICICCGRKATIIGYEKVKPSEVIKNFISKGGRCSNCQSDNFNIIG